MIDVRLRVFIPSRAVSVPTGPGTAAFDGDNRSFSFDQGTSRAELWADVDNSPVTTQPVKIKKLLFGQTGRYSMDKIEDVPGKPFWWKAVRHLPFLNVEMAPDTVATAVVDPSRLSIRGALEPGPFGIVPQVRIKFHVTGTNPLEPLAPAIDSDLDVLVSATGLPALTFSITGSHDRFPAHELYINGRLVYSFDPVVAGSSPLDLFGVVREQVNVPPTVLL